MKMLVHWVLSALALLLVSRYVPGFEVPGFWTAMLAAVVIGFVNGTLGFLLKVFTFPLSIVTFGIFLLVINAVMLKLAAMLVPGFVIIGFMPALIGAVMLALLNMVIRWVLADEKKSSSEAKS